MNREDCIEEKIMAHEALHALGMHHMHEAFDRDDYITVVFENIKPTAFSQFDKIDKKFFNYFGTSYDYESVMHYRRYSASKNGEDTIIPHDLSYIDIIGQVKDLSEGDRIRINRMYEC